MAVLITCIKKDFGNHESPLSAITSFGWVNESTEVRGSTTRLVMYDFIVNKGGVAYVKDGVGRITNLIGAITPTGTKYVKTLPNDTPDDNLLKLPECS